VLSASLAVPGSPKKANGQAQRQSKACPRTGRPLSRPKKFGGPPEAGRYFFPRDRGFRAPRAGDARRALPFRVPRWVAFLEADFTAFLAAGFAPLRAGFAPFLGAALREAAPRFAGALAAGRLEDADRFVEAFLPPRPVAFRAEAFHPVPRLAAGLRVLLEARRLTGAAVSSEGAAAASTGGPSAGATSVATAGAGTVSGTGGGRVSFIILAVPPEWGATGALAIARGLQIQ